VVLEAEAGGRKESTTKAVEQKEGPEKKFMFRESLLSIMFEIRDFQTIYNMVVASFIILTLSLIYDSYSTKGELLDMLALFEFFRGAQTVILAWLSLALTFYSIVPLMKVALRTTRWIWIPLYCLQIGTNLTVATWFARKEGLGFASVIIIMCESVRMMMKAHSYFRTKMIYLTDNPYRHFEFRGQRVVNSHLKEEEDQRGRCLNIDIREEDLFG
jgi:sterol O-acyltransferase